MTQDVQHDRFDSPLATVSDAIQPPAPSRIPNPAGDDAASLLPEPETPSTFDNDSFEGFGSFS